MKFRRQRREDVGINLTPLIDVTFLLLVFLMLLPMRSLERQVAYTDVYARVSPQHKLRIVEALRRRNCRLLAEDPEAELYDIVGDLGYFIPGYVPDESVEERQEALRERTARECAALALAD